ERWGKPAAAVLGALMAQVDLGVGAIGGKDSMSGSFEQLDVPPTLVSFATAVGSIDRVTSPEFKGAAHRVARIAPAAYDGVVPEAAGLLEAIAVVERLIGEGAALAVSTPGYGGAAEALFKMCVGNGIGLTLDEAVTADELFAPAYGSFLVELADDAAVPAAGDAVRVDVLGETAEAYQFAACGETISLADLQEAWESQLEPVFPYRAEGERVEPVSFGSATPLTYNGTIARPRVVIPVFPGNNCEYDSARAFEQAGAVVDTFVINNLTPDKVAESTAELVRLINNSQIIMLPGGFSGGDEPDGSAKFITAFFRAPAVTEAVRDLLQNRDGLMLGICNGFQALVKLGLVPFGDIRPMDESCPTLTFNDIGRHQSRLVRTRVASSLSPWLSRCEVGDVHTVPVSHGEGRFVASDELLAQLRDAGQIATQYVGADGQPSMDLDVNPNGSAWAIEGITSPDGRVLGKMGHSERRGAGLYRNVPGDLFQPLFEGGVGYFTD
ncbi:MAG: phosphoribosylformylglycinamidine synthase subunit PurQ, partial [Gordonibacter urolithinfaciens]